MAKGRELSFEECVGGSQGADHIDYLEVPASRRAFFFVGGLAALLMGVVLAKVIELNLGRGGLYVARAQGNINREVRIPAARGVITDRFGEVLAENTNAFSVFVDIPELLRERGSLPDIVARLAEALGLDPADVTVQLVQADIEKEEVVVLARNVSSAEAIAVRGLNLPAVRVGDDYVRKYADGPVFSHIVGYTGIAGAGNDIAGRDGVEAAYDGRLRGEDGRAVFVRGADGELFDERAVRPPTPGKEFKITVDAGLQRYFHARLSDQLARLGRRAAVGIALDPRNGEILSLVSLPAYDNRLFVERGYDEERMALLSSEGQPLFNRAVSGSYSPGSTIKPLLALAALREGVVTQTSQVFSDGTIEIPNPYFPDKPSVFLDWRPQGWVDVVSALARSSNIFFYAAGGGLPRRDITPLSDWPELKGVGIDRLRVYWQRFGFGAKTGMDVPAEGTGFLPSPEEKEARLKAPWRLGDTYNVSIGQGDLLVTPLQLLSFIASIGMNGRAYRPHLDAGAVPEIVRDYGGEFVAALPLVREGLKEAVEESYGTAHPLSDLPVTAAGKTGSAQIEGNTRVNAFFVGYAPADHPEIALLVLVENAREGSLNALPVAEDVLRWYYDHRLATSD